MNISATRAVFLVVSGLVVLLSVVAYVATPRNNLRPRLSGGDVRILLGIIAIIFFVAGCLIAKKQGSKDFSDYFSFAAPCFSALVVGLGLVDRFEIAWRRGGGEEAKNLRVDVSYYLLSSLFLVCALVSYLSLHGSIFVNKWTFESSSLLILLTILLRGFFPRESVRVIADGSARTLINLGLIVIMLLAGWVIYVNY